MGLLCSGCQTELDPAETACPICLRPRSRSEILRGYTFLKEEEAARRRRPLVLAASLAALGLTGYGLHRVAQAGLVTRASVGRVLGAAGENASAVLDHLAGQHEKPDLGPPARPTLRAEMAKLAEASSSPGPGPAGTAPDAAVGGLVAPTEWKIHGRIYTLIELSPAAGARIAFKDRSAGKTITAAADAEGRYSVVLPPLTGGGYSVAVFWKGRSRRFIEDDIEPFYRDKSMESRREAARQLLRSKVLHVPIRLEGQPAMEGSIALLPT